MMRRFGLLQFARFLLPPLMMIVSRCLRSYSRHLTSCFSLTWRLAAALNGVDEVLDLGDDCHEVNLLSRAKLMGIGAWNLGNVAVELVEHHKWQRSHLWTRFLSSSRFGAFACLRRLHFSCPCDHPKSTSPNVQPCLPIGSLLHNYTFSHSLRPPRPSAA